MKSPTAISLEAEFEKLTLLTDRQPDTKAEGWHSGVAAYAPKWITEPIAHSSMEES